MQSQKVLDGMSPINEGTGQMVFDLSLAVLTSHLKLTDPIRWLQNYEEALEQAAAKTGTAAVGAHLIMAFFTGSDWCPYCKYLNTEIFQNIDFRKWFNALQIVPLLLDFPKYKTLPDDIQAQNAELALEYDLLCYPTIVVIKVTDGFCLPNGQCSFNTTELGRIEVYAKGTAVNEWIKSFSKIAGIKVRKWG